MRVLHALINEDPMAGQMLMSTSKNLAAALEGNRTALKKIEARMSILENSFKEKSNRVKFHRNAITNLQNRIATEPMSHVNRHSIETHQIPRHQRLLQRPLRNFANHQRNYRPTLRALGRIRGRV